MTGMHTCVPLQAMLLLPASAKLLSRKQSSCWVCTYINTPARRNCEAASQRKWLRTSSSFGSDACGSIYMLRTLVKAPSWFAFAGSLQLSVWEGCSGSTSWALLVLFGLQAMLLLSTNAELLTHQNYNNYNWQCYLNRPTCSMWAYLPRIVTETMVRTIQCQVVSYNGWKAHGFRLNCTFILGKDSRWIPHICSTRTSCQKWQECILVSLCRPWYCFQHLQNCCLANKSRCWDCTYINSAACSNCKAASQRKWLRSI